MKINLKKYRNVSYLLVRLTKGIIFCVGGCGGGPLVLISLGCLLTTGLTWGSLGTSLCISLECSLECSLEWSDVPLSRPANASDSAADNAPTLPVAGGIACRNLSGEDFCGGGCWGWGGGNRGASVLTCPLGVEPAKMLLVILWFLAIQILVKGIINKTNGEVICLFDNNLSLMWRQSCMCMYEHNICPVVE